MLKIIHSFNIIDLLPEICGSEDDIFFQITHVVLTSFVNTQELLENG